MLGIQFRRSSASNVVCLISMLDHRIIQSRTVIARATISTISYRVTGTEMGQMLYVVTRAMQPPDIPIKELCQGRNPVSDMPLKLVSMLYDGMRCHCLKQYYLSISRSLLTSSYCHCCGYMLPTHPVSRVSCRNPASDVTTLGPASCMVSTESIVQPKTLTQRPQVYRPTPCRSRPF